MNKWFSVKDQTPDEDVPVIIYCKNKAVFIAEKKILRWSDGEETYWIVRGPLGSGRKIASSRITHWTYVPELPK